MANVKPKWWGINVILSHSEACTWTDPKVNNVASVIAAAIGNYWGQLVTATVILQKNYIRSQNESSGYKGVRLMVTWVGLYIGCERRSTGSSPCSGSSAGTAGGGSGGASGSSHSPGTVIHVQ
jgi:hypothetical protein